MAASSDTHIYLDHNATTPPHEDVLAAIHTAQQHAWANPSSVHRVGQRARAELDRARAAVARMVGLSARDVLLTSGGTEANNIALSSLLGGDSGGGLVTSAIEHPSVLRTAERLAGAGAAVAIAKPDASGTVTLEEVVAAAERLDNFSLLSIQMVNHETGVIQPLQEMIAWAHASGALVHVDAVQAVGKISSEGWRGADLLTIAAHKIRGPKGIGALVTVPRVRIAAQMGGGEQERGLRPGTQGAALAAGLRAAAERAIDGPARYAELRSLRDDLEQRLTAIARNADIEVMINGEGPRVPHVSNQSWMGWRGPELCAALDLEGVAISSGAACSAGTAEPSAVIRCMLGEARALAAIRISLGETTTGEDIEATCRAFARVVARTAKR